MLGKKKGWIKMDKNNYSDLILINRRKNKGWKQNIILWFFIGVLIGGVISILVLSLTTKNNKAEAAEVMPQVTPEYVKARNFILSFKPPLSDQQVDEIIRESTTCADIAGISPNLFLVLVAKESGFDPFAMSDAFAIGLTQVSLSDWNDASFEIGFNIRSGCRKLIYYLTESHGNVKKALAWYNGTKRRPSEKFAKDVLDSYIRLERGK
jgi:hypothetical protein